MEDPENQAKLDSLTDWKDENREFEVYQLFCENGYGKDFESFKIELRAFLTSDEIVKIFESDGNELPEEALESVAGGFEVNHAVITGLTSLVLACTGAVSLAPVISNLDKHNDASVSSEVKDDNGDSGSKFGDWDRNSDEKQKDFEKGPNGGGAKDLNRSDRRESGLKNKKSKHGYFGGESKGRIFREAQKRRGPRGGGAAGVHRFDDLARQGGLTASNVFESLRNTGETVKSRVDLKNASSKRNAGDGSQNAQNVNNEAKGDINNQEIKKDDVVANAGAKQKLTLKQIAENFDDVKGNQGLNGSMMELNRKNYQLSFDSEESFVGNRSMSDMHKKDHGGNPFDLNSSSIDKSGGREGFDVDDSGENPASSKSVSKQSQDLSNEGSQSILDEHSSLKFDSSSDSSQKDDGSSENLNLSLGFGKESSLNSKELSDLNLSAIDKSGESENFDDKYDALKFTFAGSGDENKNKENSDQNAQDMNNKGPQVIDNTGKPGVPPVPGLNKRPQVIDNTGKPGVPPVPVSNAANANVNAPQKKSMAELLAEKKPEIDKKRAGKKNNEENNKLKGVKNLVENVLVSNGKAEIRKAVEELIKEIEKNEKKHLTMEELQAEASKGLTKEEAMSVAVKIRSYFLNMHEDVDDEVEDSEDDF